MSARHLVNTKRFVVRFQPVVVIIQLVIIRSHLKYSVTRCQQNTT